jgi:type I restriction enzyme M protein
VLRDDGVGTIDYTEQLTFLLFLKMAHERAVRPLNPEQILPKECSWDLLLDSDGEELEKTYSGMLNILSKQKGTLGVIFRKAQNKIQDPAKLKRLIVDLIDKENWSATGVDIKGDAYEGLLAKGAEDVKSGAGQYFTPRAVISAIVEVMNLSIMDTVHDPACGTGGFLLAAYENLSQAKNFTIEERKHLSSSFVSGTELVDATARLAAMNLLLHGIGAPNDESAIKVGDSLSSDDGIRYSVVLANPPFGSKSSVTVVGNDGKISKEEIKITRDDFWVSTSNKQLNFIQHIKTILDINGRAAVIVPDSVLSIDGVGETVRRRLMKEFDLHTILRLPTGIFYKQGVRANVLFFDKKPAAENSWTKKVWIYDLRTNLHYTLKENPLKKEDLLDFTISFNFNDIANREESDRFRAFNYEEILIRENANLDIFWLRDESIDDASNLASPEVIAREIIDNLDSALTEFSAIVEALEAGK